MLILIVVDSPGVIEFVISNVVDVKLFCFSPNDVDNPDIFYCANVGICAEFQTLVVVKSIIFVVEFNEKSVVVFMSRAN